MVSCFIFLVFHCFFLFLQNLSLSTSTAEMHREKTTGSRHPLPNEGFWEDGFSHSLQIPSVEDMAYLIRNCLDDDLDDDFPLPRLENFTQM